MNLYKIVSPRIALGLFVFLSQKNLGSLDAGRSNTFWQFL